jgi:hypothetical protein
MGTAMVESWGIVVGAFVLVIAGIAVVGHYQRENRRAQLLKNLDHHDWRRLTRSRIGSGSVRR